MNEYIVMKSVLSATSPDDLENTYEEQEGPPTERNIPKALNGVNLLRFAVQLCDAMPESFSTTFTSNELMLLAEAYFLSDSDELPSEWSDKRIDDALGEV